MDNTETSRNSFSFVGENWGTTFASRHIGINEEDITVMLRKIGVN